MKCPRCGAVMMTSYDEQVCVQCGSDPGQQRQPTKDERTRPARKQAVRKYPRQYA